jgi:hypothetical protein
LKLTVSGNTALSPKNFSLEKTVDGGVSWETKGTWVNETAWTLGVTRTFTF